MRGQAFRALRKNENRRKTPVRITDILSAIGLEMDKWCYKWAYHAVNGLFVHLDFGLHVVQYKESEEF